MLKFHQRLLILLCTIVIISFLMLGAIITHVIYQTVTTSQEGDLEHRSQHIVSLYNHDKLNDIKDIAKNENLTIMIEKGNDVLLSTKQRSEERRVGKECRARRSRDQ